MKPDLNRLYSDQVSKGNLKIAKATTIELMQ